jgi:predicted GNAT family acetyltransferase
VVDIANNEADSQWEARLDGELAGYSEYRRRPGRIVFTHTVVEPRFEGKGIGSALVRTEVDDAVANELRIRPICPFVRAWLKRHPEYHGWVDWPAEKPEQSGPDTA